MTTPVRDVSRLAAAVVAAIAVVVLAPSPMLSSGVHACSCVDPAERLDRLRAAADATFLGTVVEIRRPEISLSSTAESRFVFEVDRVYAGDVRKRQSVVTPTDGASCGLEMPVGTTAIVFAREEGFEVTPDDGELAASLCDVVSGPSAADVASLGSGRPPTPGSSPIGEDDGLASTLARNWYWVVAGLVAFVVATTTVLRRHVRRRSAA